MGFENRDYAREERKPSHFSGDGVGVVCKGLIALTVVIFIVQLVTRPRISLGQISLNELSFDGTSLLPQASFIQRWLELAPDAVMHGQVWRLVTYAFCHDASGGFPYHILFNMLFLWWFGKTLELIYGSREFLYFYLTSAAVSGLAFVILARATGNSVPAIGASGAIMAIMMVYAMHYPRQKIYIWGIIPIEIRWLIVAYIAFDLWPVLEELGNMPGAGDGVAHSAHLGGLAFGFVYKYYGLRLSSVFDRIGLPKFGRLAGSRRKIRIYKPAAAEPDTNLDVKVDAILEKISREGEASLTDREREILKAASQRYKDR